MINDILESTKKTIFERLSSPLLGGFVASWALWNWKFLVILFSDNTVTKTFSMIEQISFPDILSFALRGLAFPLATSLIYVFIYPYPARFVYEFTLKRQREINQARQRIAEETPLTLEESRRLRVELLSQDRHHKEIVDELNREIARLNSAIEEMSQPIPDEEPPPPQKEKTILEPSQIEILLELEKFGGSTQQPTLVSRSKESKTKTEFDIEELRKKGLITQAHNVEKQENTAALTHEGRRVLLKLKPAPDPNTSA